MQASKCFTKKAFFRRHLYWVNVLYDQVFINSSHRELESFQFNTCLAITGTIRGRPKKKYIKC